MAMINYFNGKAADKAPSVAAVVAGIEATIYALANGQVAFALPDIVFGGGMPTAGSGLPDLKAGVLFFA
jgi:hypothetical protein